MSVRSAAEIAQVSGTGAADGTPPALLLPGLIMVSCATEVLFKLGPAALRAVNAIRRGWRVHPPRRQPGPDPLAMDCVRVIPRARLRGRTVAALQSAMRTAAR
jgi:hypothetical protein